MDQIKEMYGKLLKRYGPQGWWPLLDVKGTNPTKSGSIRGYHPADYSYPKNEKQRFEIAVGAVLTQNTSWANVEKALLGLKKYKGLDPWRLLSLEIDTLCDAIRPSGYYNQKAKKLRELANFWIKLEGKAPSREDLLAVWGIGKETADSILLYAFSVPVFVVDSYTKRIFSGILDHKLEYDQIRAVFEESLPRDHKVYQEYHALIVEHAKH